MIRDYSTIKFRENRTRYIDYGSFWISYWQSEIAPEFIFDYYLGSRTSILYSAPIMKLSNICEDCRKLTSGVCWKHSNTILIDTELQALTKKI